MESVTLSTELWQTKTYKSQYTMADNFFIGPGNIKTQIFKLTVMLFSLLNWELGGQPTHYIDQDAVAVFSN